MTETTSENTKLSDKSQRQQGELAKYKEQNRAQLRQIAQLTQLKQALADEKRALQVELEKRSNFSALYHDGFLDNVVL